MSETALLTRPEGRDGLPHPEWQMYADTTGPESSYNPGGVIERIRDNLVVLDEDEPAPEGASVYDYEYYDGRFHPFVVDPETGHLEERSVAEFVNTHPWKLVEGGRQRALRDRDAILTDMAVDYYAAHPPGSWWLHLDEPYSEDYPETIASSFEQNIMSLGFEPPIEQFIIGQDGRGVRFFNYGQPMSHERVTDCRRFIDVATQFFGDRVYDFLTDVVIVPFKLSAAQVEAEADGGAFVHSKAPNVMFIDSRSLSPDGQEADPRITQSSGATRFRYYLTHEFGHLLAGDDDSEVEKFATDIGWDVDGLNAHLKDLPAFAGAETHKYAPPAKYYTYTYKDGGGTERTIPQTREQIAARHHIIGAINPEAFEKFLDSYLPTGTPSTYADLVGPGEAAAEAGAYSMLGDVAEHMPEVRDAWLEFAQKRAGQPIATPIDRARIVVDYRMGDDILYPRTPLPEKIYVRAIKKQSVAA